MSLKLIGKVGALPLSRTPIMAVRRLFNRRQVLLACFPKSGSTNLASKIAALPLTCQSSFVPGYERREQELCSQSIRERLLSGFLHHHVIQCHTRCSAETIRLIGLYDLRVVVLIRNLKDCLVSLVDHWQRESCVGPQAFWTDRLLSEIDAAGITRLEAATVTVAPWYLNFYISWLEGAPQVAGPSPIWVQYETFYANPRQEFARLLNQIGFECSVAERDLAWNMSTNDRFNVGLVGRGEAAFDKDKGAADALDRLVRLYPGVNLSPILSSTLRPSPSSSCPV